MPTATASAGRGLLAPHDHALLLIDFQPQMAFATRSIDAIALRNNVAMVAEAAAGFAVPTVITTIGERTFAGPTFDEITVVFPRAAGIDRTTMNAWEDPGVIDQVNAIGRGRVVLAGLWTSVCIVEPALSALDQGFEVYVLADACGDVSVEAHACAMDRMVQAGARPMTALQYLLELQRDWARTETTGLTTGIVRRYGGSYGLGVQYARAMFGAQETQEPTDANRPTEAPTSK